MLVRRKDSCKATILASSVQCRSVQDGIYALGKSSYALNPVSQKFSQRCPALQVLCHSTVFGQ